MADRSLFTLYIEGHRPLSQSAIRNASELCEQICAELRIVDVAEHPEIAFRKRIFQLPLLVREGEGPEMRLVGDLSNRHAVIRYFGGLIRKPENGS